jgi:hypothetical protein
MTAKKKKTKKTQTESVASSKNKPRSISAQVMDARSVGTPLIVIETPDPGSVNHDLVTALATISNKAQSPTPPILIWDASSWMRALNDEGVAVLESLLEEANGDNSITAHPAEAVKVLQNAPPSTFIIMANMHRFWGEDNPAVVQALFNLRDQFKATGRTLVMTMPDCRLPSELKHDVMVLSEKLPTSESLKPIVSKMHDSAGVPQPDDTQMETAAHTLTGLAKQQAEQVVAMSLVHGAHEGVEGMSMETLRSEQYAQIEQTPGLSVYRGEASFDSLLGVDKLIGLLRNVISSKNPTRAFIFIDEIEKMLAGGMGHGDTSGTSQEQLGYILSHMQDTEAKGILLLGPAGTGKSEIAKACGREAECLTVNYDVGAMKGSLVGETGAMTRQAHRVIESLGQGNAFWIATCNSINALPVELRRRFNYGTWYVDLPSKEALGSIWKLYSERYGIKAPSFSGKKQWDESWTGAEVKTCCSMASEMGITVEDASQYISPVSRSSWETIKQLRSLASGRFLCAERGSFYRQPSSDKPVVGDEGLVEQVSGRLMKMNES